jgi:ribonuclease HI
MNTPDLKGICVLVDGGCRNNQGPVEDREMYGSMTVFHNNTQVESSVYGKQLIHKFTFPAQEEWSSNNLAELMMLEQAFQYIVDVRGRSPRVGNVVILTDSLWAASVADGSYKINKNAAPGLKKAAARVRSLFLTIQGVEIKHVDNLWVKSILGH